ncbi:MAG: hypothetical protein JSV65_20030, partial [Armatimonadota bacterium]
LYAGSRLGRPARPYWPYAGGLARSLVLAGLSLVLLLFRGDPVDALLGCAFGVVMVAGVLRVMIPDEGTPEGSGQQGTNGCPVIPAVEAGAILAVILAAGCALGVYHFHDSALRGWWAYPLALAALWTVGHVVANIASASRSAAKYPLLSLAAAGVLSAILVLVVGMRLAGKLEPVESLGLLLAGGVVTAALVAWLGFSVEKLTWLRAMQSYALAGVLVIVLVVLSFKLLAGFGAAVALLAAWAIAATTLGLGNSTARVSVLALAVGAGLLLLRLFVERSGGAVGEVELSLHYTLVGVVIGVLLPFVYSSLHMRWGLGRTLLLGVLGALSPLALLALWGPDAVLGLMVGLVGAQALGLMLVPLTRVSPQITLWHAPTPLLALGAALVAVQFSRTFAFLYEMPRLHKGYVAAGIAGVVIVWVIVMALLQLRGRMRAVAAESPGPEG